MGWCFVSTFLLESASSAADEAIAILLAPSSGGKLPSDDNGLFLNKIGSTNGGTGCVVVDSDKPRIPTSRESWTPVLPPRQPGKLALLLCKNSFCVEEYMCEHEDEDTEAEKEEEERAGGVEELEGGTGMPASIFAAEAISQKEPIESTARHLAFVVSDSTSNGSCKTSSMSKAVFVSKSSTRS